MFAATNPPGMVMMPTPHHVSMQQSTQLPHQHQPQSQHSSDEFRVAMMLAGLQHADASGTASATSSPLTAQQRQAQLQQPHHLQQQTQQTQQPHMANWHMSRK